MTLDQSHRTGRPETSADGPSLKDASVKSSRPIRNRRYTRRGYITGHRPQKRLFTPEIKRYLKDWLVRRRENPYPNREEKKYLARETGLTYIQICNWFANWRRKLKNVNMEINQQTWGHLIRTYNNRAQGNVEQFSICSDDSIWSEPALDNHALPSGDTRDRSSHTERLEHKEYYDSSSTSKESCDNFNNNSYNIETGNEVPSATAVPSPLLLSKWLESAARFQPSESNYSWWGDGKRKRTESQKILKSEGWTKHGHDEVEAAVALTALAAAAGRIPTQTS